MALFTECLRDAPWIGRVEKIAEDTVDVAWLDGGYQKPWKPATRREERRVVPWNDRVSIRPQSFFFDQIQSLIW